MTIIGLDLSLTNTGICTPDGCHTVSVKTTGMQRLIDIRTELLKHGLDLEGDDLVVIEGYSFSSRDSHAHALGELGGIIRLDLFEYGVPYVDVPPAVLKKFATGKGNANKDAMVATAARLGCPADDNNAVDAWWLYQMGLYALREEHMAIHTGVAKTAYRDEMVAKIAWPALVTP